MNLLACYNKLQDKLQEIQNVPLTFRSNFNRSIHIKFKNNAKEYINSHLTLLLLIEGQK